ncbi:phytanoyl-CoA-dioxygenase-like protein [Hyaloscypha hepaticicola]|uniref:Phytanoyl-CoA-dioxygenase-like protein n=1 Tax=Hyaloscypha hepaticicola TaxID=2082293 RepID=A0A2J6QH22_9HELO|nr:phytanoyl-CoA-dioxygenase-like protein [Hyaloscypha hepaticicola]
MQQDIKTPGPHHSPTRIQLGAGTTFLPGKKDESVKELIDHVLKHGYVILPRLFSETLVEEAKEEVGRLEKAEWEGRRREGGRNGFEGFRTRRVYALADKSRVFDEFAINETVLKLNDYFLQENYLLTSFHTVTIQPGEKEQSMHTDDGLINLPRPRPLMGIGTMVALDPFTADNGATTLIPGSHLWPDSRLPSRSEMIPAIMPAGSMVYFLNTLWHSGGANKTSQPRRSLTVQYCQPWIRPIENMIVAVGWEDLDAIPKRLLTLLGFSLNEFMGYVDGRAPRTGVEMRKKRLVEWAVKQKELENEKRRSGKGKNESKL